jgi:hypothetical protein
MISVDKISGFPALSQNLPVSDPHMQHESAVEKRSYFADTINDLRECPVSGIFMNPDVIGRKPVGLIPAFYKIV